MTAPSDRRWLGFHLFYHADRDRVLTELVRPLAAALLADGLVQRFFFIRYSLGGPHVRLRLEVRGAAAARAARRRVRAAAREFLAGAPSPEPLPDERVHRINRNVIPSDPFAGPADDVVVPDNTLREAPVRFEVERYGGPPLYGHSVDLFVLSTLHALESLEASAGASAGRRMAERMRLLLRQAWGHAADGEEFAVLADYGVRMFGAPLPAMLTAADAAFGRNGATLRALVRGEMAALAAAPSPGPLGEGAQSLRRLLGGMENVPRREAGISHMHMTANRLGMSNPDEVYLCRLLTRALAALREEQPDAWRAAWEAHRAWSWAPAAPLDAQVRSALRAFAAPAAPVPA